MLSQMEENVLFNDALDTFYLRLHGVGHIVKDHSDSGVTESLFWGPRGGGGPDLRLGVQEDHIAMIFVHNHKSNGGQLGAPWCKSGSMAPRPPP